MHFSKYNIIKKLSNGGSAIFRTLYNKIIKLNQEYFSKLAFDLATLTSDLFNFLKDNFIIYDELYEACSKNINDIKAFLGEYYE